MCNPFESFLEGEGMQRILEGFLRLKLVESSIKEARRREEELGGR